MHHKRKYSNIEFHSARIKCGEDGGINTRGWNTKCLSFCFYLKLYVVWLDTPPLQHPGIETFYAEVALRTGGGFHFTKASDFSQADTDDAITTIPLTEMEQVSEVWHHVVNNTSTSKTPSAISPDDTSDNTR
jgi:hypothetical protein